MCLRLKMFDVYSPHVAHPLMLNRIFTVLAYNEDDAVKIVLFSLTNSIQPAYRYEPVPDKYKDRWRDDDPHKVYPMAWSPNTSGIDITPSAITKVVRVR